eukprot:gene25587-18762_t
MEALDTAAPSPGLRKNQGKFPRPSNCADAGGGAPPPCPLAAPSATRKGDTPAPTAPLSVTLPAAAAGVEGGSTYDDE